MRDVNFYMTLPYTFVITKCDDYSGKYFEGRWLELDGCTTYADTIVQLYRSAEEAKQGWLAVKLKVGDPIPEPLRHFELNELQQKIKLRK